MLLETQLQLESGYSNSEKGLMHDLRGAFTDLISAHRQHLHPHTSRASVLINALETSIKRRTTGADGWPIR